LIRTSLKHAASTTDDHEM